MERRVADGHPAHLHRLELRHGRQHARASDGGEDVHDARRRLARLELPGDGPARRARDLAEPALEPDVVHLDDDAVDLVRQRVALALELGVEGTGCVERIEHLRPRHRPESPALEGLQRFPVPAELDAAHFAHAVTDEGERTRRGDARIELLQRPGGGVARVGEHRLPGLLALAVHAPEGLDRQKDLAPDLEQLGHGCRAALQAERHAADRPDVGRDVLADDPVAARRSRGEHAVLVDELDRHPVDLRLADVLDPLEVQELPDAGIELRHLLPRRDVVEREHRVAMTHRLELLEGHGADPLRRRVGARELRMLGFQLLETAEEGVVLGVRDERVVEHVVAVIVVLDLAAEPLDLLADVPRGARHVRVPSSLTVAGHLL